MLCYFRVLFIIQRVKHVKNDSVTIINRHDWKKRIAIVELKIAVEQMSHNSNFLLRPICQIKRAEWCFRLFQHTESCTWHILVGRWHSYYGKWHGLFISFIFVSTESYVNENGSVSLCLGFQCFWNVVNSLNLFSYSWFIVTFFSRSFY